MLFNLNFKSNLQCVSPSCLGQGISSPLHMGRHKCPPMSHQMTTIIGHVPILSIGWWRLRLLHLVYWSSCVSLSLGQRWWYNRRFLSAIYCYSPVNLHTRPLGLLPSLARMLTGNLRVNKRRLSTYTAPVQFYSVLNDVTNVFRCFIPLEDTLGQVSSGSSGQEDQINRRELNHLRDCNLIWFCDGRWNGPREDVGLEIKLQAEVEEKEVCPPS